jgi:NADPH-dependent curcumin reductase CurA
LIRSPRTLTTYPELIQGFIGSDHPGRGADLLRDVSGWLKEGGRSDTGRTSLRAGKNAPWAFLGPFRGENFGKLLI